MIAFYLIPQYHLYIDLRMYGSFHPIKIINKGIAMSVRGTAQRDHISHQTSPSRFDRDGMDTHRKEWKGLDIDPDWKPREEVATVTAVVAGIFVAAVYIGDVVRKLI